MFWIHGGGFQSGSGSSPGYDGTNLCKRGDVVVVTINHRLNVMGFLYLGELGGDELTNTGNVGMLDIVHALKWVRDNIESFGGDPNRVMIFGESGGGRKVGTLLAMPEAKGLFHRAAIQSGPSIKVVTREDATFAAKSVLDELQIPHKDFRKLQQLPLEQLMPAYFAASRKHRFNHATDGICAGRRWSVFCRSIRFSSDRFGGDARRAADRGHQSHGVDAANGRGRGCLQIGRGGTEAARDATLWQQGRRA